MPPSNCISLDDGLNQRAFTLTPKDGTQTSSPFLLLFCYDGFDLFIGHWSEVVVVNTNISHDNISIAFWT